MKKSMTTSGISHWWTSIALCLALVMLMACTSARQGAQSAWNQTERSCQGSIDGCLTQCSKGVSQACQVLAVYEVEEHPAFMKANPDFKGFRSESRGELERIAEIVETACRETQLQRPCDAMTRIREARREPVGSEVELVERAKAVKSTVEEARRVLREANIDGRHTHEVENLIDEAKSKASPAFSAIDAGITSERVPYEVEQKLLEDLGEAQKLADQAVQEARDLASRADQEDYVRNARRREAECSLQLLEACQTDRSGCEERCKAEPDSEVCAYVATYVYNDSPQGRGRAKRMLADICEAGTKAGCQILERLDKTERAERDLPSLFEQCEKNRARIAALKARGRAAARSRDVQAAAAAEDEMRRFEPTWARTLEQIREAISALTNDEGPRYRDLILQVKRRCSL